MSGALSLEAGPRQHSTHSLMCSALTPVLRYLYLYAALHTSAAATCATTRELVPYRTAHTALITYSLYYPDIVGRCRPVLHFLKMDEGASSETLLTLY
jgi:hypothetical protein